MKDTKYQRTGKEIKAAVQKQLARLQKSLDRRKRALDTLLEDPKRSLQVRTAYIARRLRKPGYSRQTGLLYSQDDFSDKEKAEIEQLCSRIFEIEQEMQRLALIVEHLDDDQTFALTSAELEGYGLEAPAEDGA